MLQTIQAQAPPIKKGVTMLAQKFSESANDFVSLAQTKAISHLRNQNKAREYSR